MSGIPERAMGPLAPEVGEGRPIVTYEAYRTLCESDCFHKVGVLEPDAYEAVVADDRTVYAEVESGLAPAIVAIEHESSYDAARTATLTGHEQVMFAALPFSRMFGPDSDTLNLSGGSGLGLDFAILIEEPLRDRQINGQERESVLASLSSLGKLAANKFIDPRVADQPGHETASLALYSCSFKAHGESGREPAHSLEEAWEQYCNERNIDKVPDENATGTFLLTGPQLRARPDMVDALWAITEKGFGDILGMHHPVSMEETKAVFAELALSDRSYASVDLEDGKPISWGSLLFNIDGCHWLNSQSSSLTQEIATANQQHEIPVWFSEIVSTRPMRSFKVLQLLLELAGRTQNDYRLLFESSNFASTYIVPFAEKQIGRSAAVESTREIEKLDQIDYWYVETVPSMPTAA